MTRMSIKSRLISSLLMGIAFILLGVLVFSVFQISGIQSDRQAAAGEYGVLQAEYSPLSAMVEETSAAKRDGALKGEALFAINPDYVGWIQIPGTVIDYPIARGADNHKYLTTTFSGDNNPAGSVFMDKSNSNAFASEHVILYGHRMKDGTIFSNLEYFLDADYLAENPTIVITLPNGEQCDYRVFAARITDAWDSSYRVAFDDDADFAAFKEQIGAPADASSVLTLSTCSPSNQYDERVLVHAVPV